MKRAVLALLAPLFLAMALPIAAWADHDLTCHPVSPPGGSPQSDWKYVSVRRPSGSAGGPQTSLVLTLQGDRLDAAHGAVRIGDGTSNTILVPEPGTTSASCADFDDDGIVGLTGLELNVRDVRTGEVGHISISPFSAELEEPGEAQMTLTIGSTTSVATVTIKYWVFGTELPN